MIVCTLGAKHICRDNELELRNLIRAVGTDMTVRDEEQARPLWVRQVHRRVGDFMPLE